MLPTYLTNDTLTALIDRALAEDVGTGDVTTEATIPPQTTAQGRFLAKEDGVLAGLHVAERVFAALDASLDVTWTHHDSDHVEAGATFGTAKGPARALLTAERLALNFLQRMSGIATATHRMAEAARPHGAKILDTRKTVPGLRALDKWAVRLGGGTNHRLGLFDLTLIKDNHIAAAGGVQPALRAANRYRDAHGRALSIELEVRTLDEVRAALEGDLDMLLLDNMARRQPNGSLDTERLREAVALIDGRVPTEASGNVTLDTVAAIAATGVDYISSGALTHSVNALDLSLHVELA